MSVETAQHFLHRNGKELGNKQKRLVDIQKFVIASRHLKDALKIVDWHGKQRSLERIPLAEDIVEQ